MCIFLRKVCTVFLYDYPVIHDDFCVFIGDYFVIVCDCFSKHPIIDTPLLFSNSNAFLFSARLLSPVLQYLIILAADANSIHDRFVALTENIIISAFIKILWIS